MAPGALEHHSRLDGAVALGVAAVIIAFSLSSCRSESASTGPSSVPAGIGLVDGIVRAEIAQASRESDPTPPTAGAQVAVIAGSATSQQVTTEEVGDAYGHSVSAATGADGRYRISSTLPHLPAVTLNASRAGFDFLPSQRVTCCDLNVDTPFDVHLVRVLSVDASGPSVLHVAEAVELPINGIDLDDGTRKYVYIFPSSSDPSIVAIASGQRGWVVRGLQPGIATITFDYHAVTTTLRIQVVA